MKRAVKLKKFNSVVAEETGGFTVWGPVAEKVVKYLNSDLGGEYPKSFYFLEQELKGKHTIYAGSFEQDSYINDPKFLALVEPDFEPTSQSKDYKQRRRKGT